MQVSFQKLCRADRQHVSARPPSQRVYHGIEFAIHDRTTGRYENRISRYIPGLVIKGTPTSKLNRPASFESQLHERTHQAQLWKNKIKQALTDREGDDRGGNDIDGRDEDGVVVVGDGEPEPEEDVADDPPVELGFVNSCNI